MRFRILGLLSALTVSLVPLAAAHADGDVNAGKEIFHRCAICHSPQQGVNKVGPSLFGVVGRPSAGLSTYHYSDALQGLKTTWTPAELDKWLSDPQALAPGTKMVFPGLTEATDRANVIAYLATLK
jgi:cytochrome c